MVSGLMIFIPELSIGLGILTLLMVKALRRFQNQVAQGTCVLSLLIGLASLYFVFTPAPTIYENQFLLDQPALFSQVVILIVGVILFVALSDMIQKESLPLIETYVLFLFHILGMLLTVMSISWVSLFLSLECMYLPLYAAVALRAEDRIAQEAACKYIIMGAFSTGVLLVGVSYLYAAVGQLGLADLGLIADFVAGKRSVPNWLTLSQLQVLFSLGGVFVTVAFCFKIGLAPFHFWVRDVYEGSSYTVVAMVAALPKLVMLIVWMRLFTPIIAGYLPHWSMLVTLLGLLSIFGGNLLALAQDRVRSLLAYSSIGHMGFVLLALTLASYPGYHAALVYTVGYLFTIVAVLLVMARVSRSQSSLLLIDDLKGLSSTQPLLALLLSVSFLSLLGMPPFAGFMFKMNLLYALVQANQAWLALAVVIASIIGAYYYINMIGLMFFYEVDSTAERLVLRSGYFFQVAMVAFILFLILLGVYPEFVFHAIHQVLFGSFN